MTSCPARVSSAAVAAPMARAEPVIRMRTEAKRSQSAGAE